MTKEELKIFNMEMKIDTNIEKSKEIINMAYNYIDNGYSQVEKEEMLEQLEEAEYMLKCTLNLIEELAELYENMETKNS